VTTVAIVGGGLAGGAAAAILARAGVRPLVLEREREPRDKICGEFLSAEAQSYLGAIGIDLGPLGGERIGAVRLIAGRRCITSQLPFTGLGLSRRRLDEAVLVHAERCGARVERGVAVSRVAPGCLETAAGSLEAETIFLASGKHDVRGARRAVAGADQGMIGFKSYFRLMAPMRAALQGFVEVVVFDGGYAGLQLIEDGVANLCLLVRRERFEAAGRTWPALLDDLLAEPHLRARLEGAQELSTRPMTIADVPFGFVHSGSGEDLPDVFRLGDQAAVIASFAGDGMSIALHSANLAARAVLSGLDARAYHARLCADVARPVRLASWLQRRVEIWPGQRVSLFGLGLLPRSLAHLAAWTRIPRGALRRAGLAVPL
jgi:flavin-dependent dehydrogenase